jgi:hypothetical protein
MAPVQKLRTHGARTQNDQLGFGYRSRLKTIIWLAVLLRNPSRQLVRFVDKRRVYEHFGQKAVTQRIGAGARFSAPVRGPVLRIALRRFACLTPWSGHTEFTQNLTRAQRLRLLQLAFSPLETWPDNHRNCE